MAGCGSHSCYVEKPSGQGTNGPCRCIDKFVEDNPYLFEGMGKTEAKLLATKMLHLRLEELRR